MSKLYYGPDRRTVGTERASLMTFWPIARPVRDPERIPAGPRGRSRHARASGICPPPELSSPMTKVKVDFVYAGLRTRSLARSLRFYRKLGFKVYRRGRMEHGGIWVHLSFPGAAQRLELNFYPRSNRFFEPFRTGTQFDHFGFRVSDVEAWVKELRRRKLRIVARVREEHENLVYIRDPDGNWIEFFGPVPEAQPT